MNNTVIKIIDHTHVNNLPKISIRSELDKLIENFNVTSKRNEDLLTFKKELITIKIKSKKNGLPYVFCDQANEMALDFSEKGEFRTSNIIYSELLSLIPKKNPRFINIAKNALEVAKESKDKAYILSRMGSLEQAYLKINDKPSRKAAYSIVKEKITILIELIKNYDVEKTFSSNPAKPFPTIEAFLSSLARSYETLAKRISHKKQNKSIDLLKKAKEIYIQLGNKNDELYLDKKFIYNKNKHYPNPGFPYHQKDSLLPE